MNSGKPVNRRLVLLVTLNVLSVIIYFAYNSYAGLGTPAWLDWVPASLVAIFYAIDIVWLIVRIVDGLANKATTSIKSLVWELVLLVALLGLGFLVFVLTYTVNQI